MAISMDNKKIAILKYEKSKLKTDIQKEIQEYFKLKTMKKQEFLNELKNQKEYLIDADFSDSVLWKSKFCRAILRECDFTGADFRYTDLRNTDLTEAKVYRSQIDQMMVIEDVLTKQDRENHICYHCDSVGTCSKGCINKEKI